MGRTLPSVIALDEVTGMGRQGSDALRSSQRCVGLECATSIRAASSCAHSRGAPVWWGEVAVVGQGWVAPGHV